MNGYVLDRRTLSLEEIKPRKVMKQFFSVEGIFRRRIIEKEEGNLTDALREDNYKNIIPSANTLEEATNYIKKLYGTTEEVFAAYYFGTHLARNRVD